MKRDMRRYILSLAAILFLLGIAVGIGAVRAEGPYEVTYAVPQPGLGTAASAGYTANTALGAPAAGTANSDTFQSVAGPETPPKSPAHYVFLPLVIRN